MCLSVPLPGLGEGEDKYALLEQTQKEPPNFNDWSPTKLTGLQRRIFSSATVALAGERYTRELETEQDRKNKTRL